MALFLNGKQLQCGNAIAAKPWTTLGTLTEGGLSLNVSGYTELLIYPKINGTTYFNPFVIDVSEFNNSSAIAFSIYQDNSHSYVGAFDYSNGSISFRRILISGWVSCDCVVKATCFSSGGSTTHHYSTDEQIVGTWIDGNTLYEKTISFTTPNDSNYTRQPVGLLTAEIDKIWVVDSFTYKGSIYTSAMPYAYTNNTVADEQFEGFINKSSTNVAFDYRVGNSLYEASAYMLKGL